MKTVYDCEALDLRADAEALANAPNELWGTFQQINRHRRAIRDFDGSKIPDEEVEAVLREALLAPSSGNSQPYVIHWVRNPVMKDTVASACRNQRAGRSASTLLVVVSSSRFALETASLFRAYVETTHELSQKSRDYHLRELRTARRFLSIAGSVIWSPFHALLTTAFPTLTLLPFGPRAVRHWAASKRPICGADHLARGIGARTRFLSDGGIRRQKDRADSET